MPDPTQPRFEEPVGETPSLDDSELLRRYAEDGSQQAFAQLVRRRINLVYSVALRQTRGDHHRAEDVTQAVFSDLARKARSLAQRPVLSGWLYRSAQFASAQAIRTEHRRQMREQEAQMMEMILEVESPEADWQIVRPVLDQALSELAEPDRDAILLRYFDRRPFGEIGARLRLTENTARMRVERALDKLGAILARHGITSTSTALGVAIGQQAGAAAPAGLAATVTGAVLAAAAGSSGAGLAGLLAMTKLQWGIAGGIAVAGAAGIAFQAQTNAALRRQIAAVQVAPETVAALRAENQRLAAIASEVETLRQDDTELRRLAQRIADVREKNEQAARMARQQAAELQAQAEVDRLNREGNALVEEFKALLAQSKDPSLTPEARAQAEAASKLKLAAIQAKKREVDAYREAAGLPAMTMKRRPENPAPTWPGEIAFTGRPVRDAFAVIAKLSGTEVVLDPSLANLEGTIDVHTGPCTPEHAILALRTVLREEFGITIDRTSDGRLRARSATSK